MGDLTVQNLSLYMSECLQKFCDVFNVVTRKVIFNRNNASKQLVYVDFMLE